MAEPTFSERIDALIQEQGELYHPAPTLSGKLLPHQTGPTEEERAASAGQLLRGSEQRLAPITSVEMSRLRNAPTYTQPKSFAASIKDIIPSYIMRNRDGDIPLDPFSGASTRLRAGLAFMRTEEEKQFYLESNVGHGNVRRAKNGDFIIRVLDEATKKPKDVVVDPYGPDFGDFMDAANFAPEVAGAGIAIASSPVAKAGLLRTSIEGAVGAAAGGGLKDVVQRLAHGTPVDPAEIATERAKLAIGDFGVGLAMGGIARSATGLISPVMAKGEIAKEAAEGRAFAKANNMAAIEYPETPAGATGAHFLERFESFMSGMPGSSWVFDRIKATQLSATRQMQNRLVGLPDSTGVAIPPGALPESGAVGKSAIDIIRDDNMRIARDIKRSREWFGRTLAESVQDVVDSMVGGGRASAMISGRSIKEGARAIQRAWTQTNGYKEFFAEPWTTQAEFPIKTLSDRAKELLKKISGTKVTKEPMTIVGARGEELVMDVKGQFLPSSMAPSGTKGILQDLANNPEATASLDTLKAWRSEIEDDILKNSPTPGVKNHILREIRKAFTEAMDDAVSAQEKTSGQPGLLERWKKLNADFATNAKKYDEPPIHNLFREPPHTVADDAAFSRAVDDPSTYKAYKDFFGANSPQMISVKRGVMDEIVGTPELNASGVIDLKGFVARLKKATETKGDILADIYGGSKSDFEKMAQFLDKWNQAGSITVNDMEDIMRNYVNAGMLGTSRRNAYLRLSIEHLKDTLEIEGTAFMNSIRRQVSSDIYVPDSIRASDFVTYMARQSTPKEIKEVLQVIFAKDPGTALQIRIRAVADIFNASAQESAEQTMASVLASMKTATASGLKGKQLFGEESIRENYRAMIGDDAMERIINLAKILSPAEKIDKGFETGAALGRGAVISRIGSFAWDRLIPDISKRALAGFLYSSLPKGYLANQVISPQTKISLMKAAIASAPFARYLTETYGFRVAENIQAQTMEGLRVLEESTGPSPGQYRVTTMPDWDQKMNDLLNSPTNAP